MVLSMNDSAAAAAVSCLLCWLMRNEIEIEYVERDFMRADGNYLLCRVCLTNHGRGCRLGEM